jgi:hypothetical protein
MTAHQWFQIIDFEANFSVKCNFDPTVNKICPEHVRVPRAVGLSIHSNAKLHACVFVGYV